MFYKRFGHLRVLGISDKTDNTNVHFVICICDCGKLFHTRKVSVLSGRTKSCCGYISIEETIERFKSNIIVDENDCWIWNGDCYRRNGVKSYGRFYTKSHPEEYLAHRFSFIFFKGSIPKNMYICHLCDVQSCVNPDHLFLGDCKSNSLDMVVKGRSLAGEKNPNSKYTEKDVLIIRDLHSQGKSYTQISNILGLSKSTIANLAKHSWKHI